MKIRYVVRRYALSQDPQHCTARVVSSGRITFERLVDLVAARNTTVSRSDVLAVLEDHDQVLIERLLDGYTVDTPLVDFSLAIEGLFLGMQDRFDPRRHKVVARFRPGRRLRQALRNLRGLELADEQQFAPFPGLVVDAASGTQNERLTRGSIVQVWGYRLKFDPQDPSQGVFLVDEDHRETKVTVVGMNKPKQLFFQVPADLPAGRYRLEVRNVPRHGSELRRGAFPELLTVE